MRTLAGIAAGTGIAIGPLFVYRPTELTVERHHIADAAAEQARYDGARRVVAEALQAIADQLAASGKDEEASIFEIQGEFLEDPTFGDEIRERIGVEQINAESAVETVTRELVEEFAEIEDDYFAQRTNDIQDLGRRLLRRLLGVTDAPLEALREPSIVVAHDLTPSDTATMDPDAVLALVTEVGSATSHTAILSRGLGIPSIVGLGTMPTDEGVTAIVDALVGHVIVDPDARTLADYHEKKRKFDVRRQRMIATAQEEARPTDGAAVEVVANIGNLNEARQSLAFGAEGAGLLRTEFLFLDRPDLPSEEEQYALYRSIADTYGSRPVVVRTMDIGGDKPLPAVPQHEEQNPFLGQRAIRLALADQERLLLPQLRALLRASVDRNVKIMFPMVATTGEIRALQAALASARTELHSQGVSYNRSVEVGIMVEIPAAAVAARRLAPLVDFFSIGTNDLTQYTLAADRTNERVAHIADYFEPAVLDLIKSVIDASHAHGIRTGMCGEMAGDPLAIPLLLGLGLDEFSMSPSMIPDIKDRIRHLSIEESRSIAARCLEMESAERVRSVLAQYA